MKPEGTVKWLCPSRFDGHRRKRQVSRSADILGSGFGNRRSALKGTMSIGIHGPPEEALGVERDFEALPWTEHAKLPQNACPMRGMERFDSLPDSAGERLRRLASPPIAKCGCDVPSHQRPLVSLVPAIKDERKRAECA